MRIVPPGCPTLRRRLAAGGRYTSIGLRAAPFRRCCTKATCLLASLQTQHQRKFRRSTLTGNSAQSATTVEVPPSSEDATYTTAAAYLRGVGFTNTAELARVLDVAMNPDSLFVRYIDPKRSKNRNARQLDVETDIKVVVEFLLDKGIKSQDVVKIISGHPPILSYSVENRLIPLWEYLESFNINVAATLTKRPSLVGLDADDNLRKIVDYLRYIKTPEETIVKYLEDTI